MTTAQIISLIAAIIIFVAAITFYLKMKCPFKTRRLRKKHELRNFHFHSTEPNSFNFYKDSPRLK